MKRIIDGFEFERIAPLQLETDAGGRIVEYGHRLPPDVKSNRYAGGPFCRLTLPGATSEPGVYAIIVAGDVRYIGECRDLKRRFGPTGYALITARNCHRDGQATNCKLNALVLAASKAGQLPEVWFYRSPEHKLVETRLLSTTRPAWNGAQRTGPRQPLGSVEVL